MARLALLAVSERDVQRLLDHAVTTIAEALSVAGVVRLYELLPDGATLVLRATSDAEAGPGGRAGRTSTATMQARFTLQAGEPVLTSARGSEGGFRLPRTRRVPGPVSTASVPLSGRGPLPYGVLEVEAGSRPLVVPAEEVVDFLQGAGALIASAVERARVEASCRFLAQSETLLVSTRDFRESVVALAGIAVPRLADWCCVDIVSPSGVVEPVALVHRDPTVARAARLIRERVRADPEVDAGVARVLRTGSSEFHVDLGVALSAGPGHDEAVAELEEAAGFRAAIVAPLAARGHVFGAMTLVAQPRRLPFDGGDLLLADVFAAHAGLALDNVRLFYGEEGEPWAIPRIAGLANEVALASTDVLGARLLEAVAEEKIRLGRVVDSIVLASRLRPEGGDVAARSSDIVAAVRVAVDGVRSALSPAHELELADPTVLAAGDSATLRRIVTYLVENAVAYSPEGGTVRVRLEVGRRIVRLSVADEGIGIPPEERERVFDRFFRGEVARSAHVAGVGLGLSILRELVSRLNGTVELVSGDQGTTLIVELPLEDLASAGT